MMTDTGTILELLDIAIQAELNAKALYTAIARKFSNYPNVALFWERYADEEEGHSRWIQGLKSRVSAEKLAQPADPDVLRQARKSVNVSVDDYLNHIKDLQDAYELANELEHSETNVIFEFLIAHFAQDPQTQTFLRTQLRDHVARLMIEFPVQFNQASMRRAIRSNS